MLVQLGDEARLSSPQNIVTGKVHGFVKVADGQAEPQHAVREVDGPLGCLQGLNGVSQTQHCWDTDTSVTLFTLWNFKNDKMAAALTFSGQAHVCFQLTDGFAEFSCCPTLLQGVAQQGAGILSSPVKPVAELVHHSDGEPPSQSINHQNMTSCRHGMSFWKASQHALGQETPWCRCQSNNTLYCTLFQL